MGTNGAAWNPMNCCWSQPKAPMFWAYMVGKPPGIMPIMAFGELIMSLAFPENWLDPFEEEEAVDPV